MGKVCSSARRQGLFFHSILKTGPAPQSLRKPPRQVLEVTHEEWGWRDSWKGREGRGRERRGGEGRGGEGRRGEERGGEGRRGEKKGKELAVYVLPVCHNCARSSWTLSQMSYLGYGVGVIPVYREEISHLKEVKYSVQSHHLIPFWNQSLNTDLQV
jgi:hypothetical protein